MINTTIFKSAFVLLLARNFVAAIPVKVDTEVDTESLRPPETIPETESESESSPISEASVTLQTPIPQHASLPLVPGDGDVYDQRQNGSKNVRIHVDGLVLVVAPAEALFFAGLEPDIFGFGNENVLQSAKPETAGSIKSEHLKSSITDSKRPLKQKSAANRHPFRLGNLLAPILKRITP